MNSELLEFTRRALEKGIARPAVEGALKQAGWPQADIESAIGAFAQVEFPLPVPKPKPYLSAREVFIYLVMFTALYVSAYNLGSLAFEFIDRAFPDPLQNVNAAFSQFGRDTIPYRRLKSFFPMLAIPSFL